METAGFKTMTPEALRDYMAKRKESKYALIDVRQPEEYTEAHIPGSRLFPLMELQSKVFDLPGDQDLIFYCHVGGRSAFAADLASEAEVTDGEVYSLEGGIMAWDGKTLADYPKVQVFDASRDFNSLMLTAMDLEKGAFRFYQAALDRFRDNPVADTLDTLSKAETAHAKMIYTHWKDAADNPEPFDALFENLSGEILEGGQTLADALGRLETIGNNPCLRVLELAMRIEWAAYDLYRNMADRTGDADVKSVLLSIAQAEKGHMKTLVKALDKC